MQLKNINEKIRRRRKQKKKTCPLDVLKISTYDVDNENYLLGDINEELQPNFLDI